MASLDDWKVTLVAIDMAGSGPRIEESIAFPDRLLPFLLGKHFSVLVQGRRVFVGTPAIDFANQAILIEGEYCS